MAPWLRWQAKLYWLITQLGCVKITVVHPAPDPWGTPCCITLSTLSAVKESGAFCALACVWCHISHYAILCQGSQPSSLIFPSLGKHTALQLWWGRPELPKHLPHLPNAKPAFSGLNNRRPQHINLPDRAESHQWHAGLAPPIPSVNASLPLTVANKEKRGHACGVWASATWSTKPLFHCKSGIKNLFNTQGYAVVWQWWEFYCTLMGPACADRQVELSCSGRGAPSPSSVWIQQIVILSSSPYSSPVHH